MGAFIIRRLLMLVPFLFLVSALAFVVIQLPPGSFVDTYRRNLEAQGGTVNEAQLKALEARYGLDKPLVVQYGVWISNILFRGDFGNSFTLPTAGRRHPVGASSPNHRHIAGLDRSHLDHRYSAGHYCCPQTEFESGIIF